MRPMLVLIMMVFLVRSVAAESVPDGSILGTGLRVVQNGAVAPVEVQDGVYRVTLAPAPFAFELMDGQTATHIGLTFGLDGLFDLLEEPPETGLFGGGTAYARYPTPDAAHYFTDPVCMSAHYGPGFNLLVADHRRGALYPVMALEPDSRSGWCEADGMLPGDQDIIGRVPRIYAVIRVDDGPLVPIIFEFAGS